MAFWTICVLVGASVKQIEIEALGFAFLSLQVQATKRERHGGQRGSFELTLPFALVGFALIGGVTTIISWSVWLALTIRRRRWFGLGWSFQDFRARKQLQGELRGVDNVLDNIVYHRGSNIDANFLRKFAPKVFVSLNQLLQRCRDISSRGES